MTAPIQQKEQMKLYDPTEGRSAKKPWFGELDPMKSRDYSFAVIGDRCGITTPGVFERGLDLVRSLKPDFVMSVGDLIEGYWENESEAHAEWDYVDTLLKSLAVPFFHVVGNHDYGNETMVKVWRERKGFEYYAFRHHESLFLVVNTEEEPIGMTGDTLHQFRQVTYDVARDPGQSKRYVQQFMDHMMAQFTVEDMKKGNVPNISDEQLQFFQNVLDENPDVKMTFVFMHKPSWKSDSVPFQKLEDMLNTRSYTMFAGHLHQLEVMTKEDRTYIQMGRTGACWHGDSVGSIDHILWVTVKDGEVHYQVIDLDAVSTLERFELHVSDKQEVL